MIITQKFNSVDEIDPEFIPSLEELLCEQVPHFDLIRKYEKTRNENIHFNYFLFFGDQTNAPIGFAQMEIEKDKTHHESFIDKFFKKKKVVKTDLRENRVRWQIPGSSKEGVVFNPKYIRYAADKASGIFKDFIQREDIHTQELYFSSAYSELSESLQELYTEKKTEPLVDALVKSRSSYADFLQMLPPPISHDIQELWKYFQKSQQLKMGEYTNFREVFEYKKNGALQYKGLKNHPQIKMYLNSDHKTHFFTLEDDKEVHSLVIYYQGKNGHCFYNFFQVRSEIPTSILHQQAILNFFEDKGVIKLHFLGEKNKESNEYLKALGYTLRQRTYLKMKKPEY